MLALLTALIGVVPLQTSTPRTSGTRSSSVAFALRGQVFTRAVARRAPGGDWDGEAGLSRARLTADFYYLDLIRIQLEPEFRGFVSTGAANELARADISDLFMEITPLERGRHLAIRLGQAKTPFGAFESESRWDLPVLTRGLTSDVLFDRLDFAGRRLGAKARLRIKALPLSPDFELGGYGDLSGGGEDAAARLRLKAFKGARVSLAGYSHARALQDGSRGYAGALGFDFDRKRWRAVIEGLLGRAQLLSQTGQSTQVDATLFAVRGLVAHEFQFSETWSLEPFIAGDIFDPNLNTSEDLGFDLRAGSNLLLSKVLRFGLELGRQTGQRGFVSASRNRVIFFIGAVLE